MSHKNLDKCNRWRNKTIGFRVSPEEWKRVELAVKLSGFSKQEYITNKLTDYEMSVNPNPRAIKALRNEIAELIGELRRVTRVSDEENELVERLEYVTGVLMGL